MRLPPIPAVSLLLGGALFLLTGCGDGGGIGKRPVTDEADPEMTAAWEKARATFERDFMAEYDKLDDAPGVGFVARVAFGEGDTVEHLWVSNIIQVEGGYEGLVDTQPELLRDVKKNEMHFFRLGQVTDWMYVNHDGVMVGGYTINLDRARMTDEEREAFDESHPFKFPPVESVKAPAPAEAPAAAEAPATDPVQ